MRLTLCTLALACAALAGAAAAEPLPLAKKAAIFEHDMEARFLLDGQALCKLILPAPGREFTAYNMPDNAYMTGIYTGALAMKYAVTQNPADREAVSRSVRALHRLCTVSGKPGLLARAFWPADRPMIDDGAWRESEDGRWRWRGDVSTDQMAGVFYGFSLAHALAATDEDKALIARDAAALADRVLDNGLRIIGYDGEPTVWSHYDMPYVRMIERLNALLLLQLLKVTHQVTGEDRYAAAYRRYALDEGYAEAALRARRHLNPNIPGFVNQSDDVLLFLGYEPLLRLEEDPGLHAKYVESYRNAWEGSGRFPGMKPEGNPLYAFLAARHLGEEAAVASALDTLRWFPLGIKWNADTIAAYETQFGFTYDPGPWSPEPPEKAPAPVDRRVKTWSAWVQDPYNSAGAPAMNAAMEFNGHDYLWGYWMGRWHGHVPAD
jgi:hypothetical protein